MNDAQPIDPPEPGTYSVIICAECGHGIDPHGCDPGGACGVVGADGNPCQCFRSPNDIAAATPLLVSSVSTSSETSPDRCIGDLIDEYAAQVSAVFEKETRWIAQQERDLLRASIQRVRDLHRPVTGLGYREDGSYGDIDPACSTCGTDDEYAVPWPCPTIRALDGAAL